LTTIYNFTGGLDGGNPAAALIQATDGNSYSTTNIGGANCTADGGAGCGTIFQITPSGTLTTLYNFCPGNTTPCPDGETPTAGLFQATNGTFYGTTATGGNSLGYGTAFSL